MSEEIIPDETLDCSGLSCPLPILKTKKVLKGLASGKVLKTISTDPGTNKDMASFCRQTGNELLKVNQQEDSAEFYIKAK
ncbi:MAG: sulfurtransferase TusA family protein [Proteobacteria bacterium]|nr:sulfurtransferase TusA family protein [Pseudomonadota bacterium]